MMKTIFLTAFTFASTILSAQTIANTYYTDYGCSDFTGALTFYNNKDAEAACFECGSELYLLTGKWSQKNDKVYFTASKLYTIENKKAIVKNSNKVLTFPIEHFMHQEDFDNGCYAVGSFGKLDKLDKHEALRLEFQEKYPFTKTRLVTHNDVANLSKQELRLMRNEIYARYGLIFNSADLKKHFNSLDGYEERATDVTAFLSEIEIKNIDFIKSYE